MTAPLGTERPGPQLRPRRAQRSVGRPVRFSLECPTECEMVPALQRGDHDHTMVGSVAPRSPCLRPNLDRDPAWHPPMSYASLPRRALLVASCRVRIEPAVHPETGTTAVTFGASSNSACFRPPLSTPSVSRHGVVALLHGSRQRADILPAGSSSAAVSAGESRAVAQAHSPVIRTPT
jgi:hypothetical protein